MTYLKILTVAALAASTVAISPSVAQNRGGGMGGGAPAPGAPAAAGASVGAGANRVSTGATVAPNAGAVTRTSQMNAAPTPGTAGGAWRGNNWNGRYAANSWNRNWSGRNWGWDRDRRFRRGPGFAFGFGFGAPYYDDYAYAGYPYDSYAYYDDPYYSNSFYDAGPTVGYAVGVGADPAYCMRRFRSYDPASGTYLGYDGMRHPCP